jgi:drug/metabolite transporter (DMT)-like permease
MSWFFLAILYVFLGSFANILRKILLRDDKSDALGLAIIFQLMAGIIIGIVAFWHGFIFPSLQLYPLNFLFAAVLWGFATLTIFKAYQYIEASEVTIITTLEAIVVIIVAHFALREHIPLLMQSGQY